MYLKSFFTNFVKSSNQRYLFVNICKALVKNNLLHSQDNTALKPVVRDNGEPHFQMLRPTSYTQI